ncbi:MAG: MFS transporter [Sulfolobales archaeon]
MSACLMALRNGWRFTYALGATLNTFTWGLYFSFTRYYLGIELGGGTSALILITGLEWVFTLFAVVSGRLVRRIGGRSVTLLGISGALPLLAGLKVHDPNILAVVLSLASFSWAIAWPSILLAVFSGDNITPGRAYSYFTIGSGVGYSLGSTLMGVFYNFAGSGGVFTTLAAMYVVTFLTFYILYPTRELQQRKTDDYKGELDVIHSLLPILVAFSLIVFSRELLYSVGPVKLASEIRKLLPTYSEVVEYTVFGAVFGGITALISVPARIVAGRLSDRFNPLYILASTGVAYLITYWIFVSTEGLIPIIIWQLPLYPFLDVSVNTYIAKYVPKHAMALGFGTVLTFSAIGGLMLLPILMNPEVRADFLGFLVSIAVIIAVTLISIKTIKR